MSFDNTDVFSHPQFDNTEPEPISLEMSDEELHVCLLYINYYRKLHYIHQAVFRGRVREFVENKIIIGIKNIHLPDSMRAFIAASAVQLTFGLKEWYLYHFHTIRIYPKEFYSRINNKMLKGGAGQNGIIWFSWKDYLAGYADQENGINLGLHEMGHALMINMQKGGQDSEFNEAFDQLVEIEQQTMPMVQNGSIGFLRKYAGANINEFFAVSIEHFFEQPVEFKKMLPVLYHAISNLLHQDPASNNLSYDYSADSSQPVKIEYNKEPVARKKNFRFAQWHWSLSVLLLGIFASPIPLIYLCSETFAPASFFWSLYLGFVVVGGILFYKKLVPTQALDKIQFTFFLLFGIGPLALAGTLLINRVPAFHETEEYTMTGSGTYLPGGMAVNLEGYQYDKDIKIRTVKIEDIQYIKAGRTLRIHFGRGIFGMKYFESSEIVQ